MRPTDNGARCSTRDLTRSEVHDFKAWYHLGRVADGSDDETGCWRETGVPASAVDDFRPCRVKDPVASVVTVQPISAGPCENDRAGPLGRIQLGCSEFVL